MNVNMLNNLRKRMSLVLAVLLLCLPVLTACKGGKESPDAEPVDYAASVKLDMDSDTLKQTVTVKTFVDGDTTHFNVPESVMPGGVFKARYLAINTPESTGKIEEWGKKASNFTREKLSGASSIIIESDDDNWDADSTGGRYLVWVWYRNSETEEYRNLNIEILQNGLAIASNSANNRYGTTAVAAIDSAKKQKLNIYSGEKDPDFFYGEAVELTLKELRTTVEQYKDIQVAFEGVITKNYNNAVYVESYDEETGLYYGIMVYYGFNLSGEGLEILTVGNLARIVGKVQYYEAGGSYQVSGLTYRAMKPDDPGNIQKLGDGYSPSFKETSASELVNGKMEVSVGEETKTFDYGYLALATTVEIKNLDVVSVYTTNNEESSSNGALTLTCKASDGTEIAVRTVPLHDASGNMITADAYEGKYISVKGIVDSYDGKYQVKVLSAQDITIN
ncbi:MAG: thermonuclease family protein [Lachnospiraceae bacterium]|nr:thermonuclease family protein [Lachnospiraceae bacterium]MBR5732319.1 thermonuclease family protein [Lachnospiraceae bacterium]